MKTIQELKSLWQREKEHYQRSEIGSGVMRFVYDVLQCEDIFGLSEGLQSTPTEKRKNEYLLEKRNKAGRADAVIFIDQDIIVPVEVEKFQKIKSGEWQILKYRTALDKKTGILTDGYEWRFYYGDIEDKKYYEFTIEEILDDTERFLVFWKEYIQPQAYYLSFFEEVGQQKMEFWEDTFLVDDNRERFFEDITEVIEKLKSKLLNAGYFERFEEEKEKNQKATEIAYSYLIQFILYKTLVDNFFGDFQAQFDKKAELIHSNLKKESYNYILTILEGMSVQISENIYKPFIKEQEVILEQVKGLLYSGEENLANASPFLDILVFIKRYNFANIQNDIFGAIYENYLKALYEEKNFGQYFTAPEVVDFMLEELGYTAEEIKKRNHQDISIVDPACGSGTFLYSVVRELMASGNYKDEAHSKMIEEEVLENVFGLDIAEFPLYLAEMSILMKMLPMIVNKKYNNPIDKKLKLFVSEDSVAEFVDDIGGRGSAKGGDNAGQIKMDFGYTGFMRDQEDIDEMKRSLNTLGSGKSTIPRKRFDYVIGNPPYISYNECCKLGIKVFKEMKSKEIKLNNIYGWNLHSVENKPKSYRPNPNLYAFFMALGFGLLKESGKFCYVIPQTLLTAGDLDVIRYKVAKDTTIEKLITFSGNLFIGRGTTQKKKVATSSLIIVCTKKQALQKHEVECIHHSNSELDINDVFSEIKNSRSLFRKYIPQKVFRENIENWNFIQWDKKLLSLYEKYKEHSDIMAIYYDHKEAELRFKSSFWFDGGYDIDEKNMLPRLSKNDDYFIPKIQKDRFSLGTAGYWKNERNKGDEFFIKLRQGNQGYNFLDSKFKVIWSYANPKTFFYSKAERIIWPRNKYCGIGTENYSESIYLFAVLNSVLNFTLLKSFLKSENEKSILLSLTSIKTFVRPPLINSPQKEQIKAEIIELTEKILDMEKQTVGDLVKLDTLTQSFDDVAVDGNKLILKTGSNEIKSSIQSGSEELLQKIFEAHFSAQKKLAGERSVDLDELLELPAFDQEAQIKLKDEIDNLVFELYEFNNEDKEYIRKLAID